MPHTAALFRLFCRFGHRKDTNPLIDVLILSLQCHKGIVCAIHFIIPQLSYKRLLIVCAGKVTIPRPFLLHVIPSAVLTAEALLSCAKQRKGVSLPIGVMAAFPSHAGESAH